MNHLIDVLKGSKCKKFTAEEQLQLKALSGRFQEFEKCDFERLIRKMIAEDLIGQELKRLELGDFNTFVSYLRLGDKADRFCVDAASHFELPVVQSVKSSREQSPKTEEYQNLLDKHSKLQIEHRKLQEEHRRLLEEKGDSKPVQQANLLNMFDDFKSEPLDLDLGQPATSPKSRARGGGGDRKRKR